MAVDLYFASSLSDAPDLSRALHQAAAALRRDLPRPDLVLGFAAGAHAAQLPALARGLQERFEGARTLGCSAVGVIGGGQEREGSTALALVGARLPGVRTHALRLPGGAEPSPWAEQLALPAGVPTQFILLPTPDACEVPAMLAALDARYPGVTKVGGVATSLPPLSPGVFVDGEVQTAGAVGVALCGPVACRPLVSQSCRPIGRPMIVTRCEGHVIHELDVGTPVAALRAVYGGLDARDQALCHHALMLGVQARAQRSFAAGDFLIGDVLGMEPKHGSLACGRPVERLQVVQFHLRDARSASSYLEQGIAALPPMALGAARGALLFSCSHRGEGLFGYRNHDSAALQRGVGRLPIGGFFCGGEIGPLGADTCLHGYASSVAFFEAR